MKTKQSLQPKGALVTSIVILVASYTLSFSLAFFTRSWLFHFEAIYLPNLFSSILGLINLICDLGIYDFLGVTTNVITSLVLAMLSILCWTFCSLLVFRKIHLVRKRDGVHRGGTSSAKTFTMPETELQRQQLLRLLLSQEDNRNADSPDKGPEATYKIQWPGSSTTAHTRRNTMSTIRNNMPFNRFNSRRSSPHNHYRSHSGNSNIISTTLHRPYHQYPSEPLTGGIERVMPDVIVEEPTMTSHSTNQSPSEFRQPPLQPHTPPTSQHTQVHNPLLPAFFDHHPGERIPSYAPRSSSHYTQGTGTQTTPFPAAGTPNINTHLPPHSHTPLNANPPPLGPHGYPVEKPNQNQPRQQTSHGRLRLLDNYTVVEDEEAIRRRMEAFGRGGTTEAGEERQFELEDRGAHGIRQRPELQGDLWRRV